MQEFTYSQLIKNRALYLGFDLCGIARSRPLTEHHEHLSRWLEMGHHGGLGYMERNLKKRIDPATLVDSARSVIVCAISYNRAPIREGIASRIASYALCTDYHITIRKKLNSLLDYIAEIVPKVSGRVFVDTAPILEKGWAVEAGLGWIGRNSLLVNPKLGSFLLLGVVVVDAELDADNKNINESCAGCNRCVVECPAQAIGTDRTINASKCISRLTIEKNGESEADLKGWIFGCDICQRVCPYNNHAPIMNHDIFAPNSALLSMDREQWLQMKKEEFKELFGLTPLSRCSLDIIQKRVADLL